jgi:hypothetical protein
LATATACRAVRVCRMDGGRDLRLILHLFLA